MVETTQMGSFGQDVVRVRRGDALARLSEGYEALGDVLADLTDGAVEAAEALKVLKALMAKLKEGEDALFDVADADHAQATTLP